MISRSFGLFFARAVDTAWITGNDAILLDSGRKDRVQQPVSLRHGHRPNGRFAFLPTSSRSFPPATDHALVNLTHAQAAEYGQQMIGKQAAIQLLGDP